MEEVNLRVLQQERGKLEAHMEDLTNTNEEYFAALECEEKRLKEHERYENLDYDNQTTLRSLSHRISDLELQREDGRSVCSKRSIQSKCSRTSDGSKMTAASSSSVLKRAEMAAKAARLGAELKFHDIESQKTVTLKKQEDEVKKVQMMKELAATQAELEAVIKVEEEQYGALNKDKSLPNDSCADDQLERYLLSQMNSILQTPSPSCPLSVPNDSGPNATPAPISRVKAETNITCANGPDPPKPRLSTWEEKPYGTQSSSARLNPCATILLKRNFLMLTTSKANS